MKSVFIFMAISVLFSFSCKKKNQNSSNGNEKLFTFNSLKSDKDTIKQGNVTNIRASFAGEGTLSWSATAGDVFGSGGVILFGASTCCTGGHTITCTIKDKNNNSESKAVSVYVTQ